MGLGEVQIGLLASIALLGGAIATLPAGALTEVLRPRVSAIFSVAAVSLMTISMSLAVGFYTLAAILLIKGAMGRLMEPAVAVAVSATFPYRQRGMALAAVDAGAPLGQMSIAATLPILAQALGWKIAVIITGIAALLVLPLLMRIMRGDDAADATATRRPTASYRAVFGHRGFARLIAGQVAYRIVQGGLLTFIILYLSDSLGMNVVVAGLMLALAQASGAVSRLVWAWFQDRYFFDHRPAFIAYVALLGTLGLGILAFLPRHPSLFIVAAATVLAGSSVRGIWPSMVTVATELGEETIGAGRSTSIIMMASAAGAVVGPPLFGAIVSSVGYPAAWLSCSALMLVMAWLVRGIRTRD